ncbi:helix-turn-helix transcriptional regulator [Agrobacterium larrymoorei]
MANRVLAGEEVIQRAGLSRHTFYSEISEGLFPKGAQLTARRVG